MCYHHPLYADYHSHSSCLSSCHLHHDVSDYHSILSFPSAHRCCLEQNWHWVRLLCLTEHFTNVKERVLYKKFTIFPHCSFSSKCTCTVLMLYYVCIFWKSLCRSYTVFKKHKNSIKSCCALGLKKKCLNLSIYWQLGKERSLYLNYSTCRHGNVNNVFVMISFLLPTWRAWSIHNTKIFLAFTLVLPTKLCLFHELKQSHFENCLGQKIRLEKYFGAWVPLTNYVVYITLYSRKKPQGPS